MATEVEHPEAMVEERAPAIWAGKRMPMDTEPGTRQRHLNASRQRY